MDIIDIMSTDTLDICEVCFAPLADCFCEPHVTAAVTDDPLNCLPEFLDRSKGDWPSSEAGRFGAGYVPVDEGISSDAILSPAGLYILSEQEQEAVAQLKKGLPTSVDKSRARIAKMKSNMADRAAVKAGKTWDAYRGKWR